MTSEPRAALELAIKYHQMGRLREAEQSYTNALRIEKDNATALHYLGVLRYQQARYREAVQLIGAALKAAPRLAEAWSNFGLALQAMGEMDKSIRAFDRAIELDPQNSGAMVNRGNTLRTLGLREEALRSFDLAMTLAPDHADALNGRGATLRELGRYPEALESLDLAVKARPHFAEAFSNRGATLQDMGRTQEALESFQAAIAVKPDEPLFHNNIGALLHQACRFDEALVRFEAALKLAPGNISALYHRGVALQSLGRLADAAACFDKVRALDPNHPHAFGAVATVVARACDWERCADIGPHLLSHIDRGFLVPPMTLLAYGLDARQQFHATKAFVAKSVMEGPLFDQRVPDRSGRIRVAYLSGDFHEHATAYLTAEIFERHDRARFDIMAISYGPDDDSSMRRRLEQAFAPHFHDVRGKSDDEIAQLLFDANVDIAVDLKGLTQDSRPGILARRPTPISVNYLGFPATMAMSAVDYIIADRVALPDQDYYPEKIVHMPVAYQPRDTRQALSEAKTSRSDFGLPDQGLVFCCFNNSWKMSPAFFDIWMRLLRSVPGSVFWLLEDNADAKMNLQKAAQDRGVDPARLVFSTRIPLPRHLERQAHADLFLDTLPYNAHTTASDALWAGVPLVTCRGETFAGRVAASLLTTLDLSELVTDNLEDYEKLALALAADRDRLGEIRKKLALNKDSSALFKMDRFTKHLETAYETMIGIAAAGEAPRNFTVPDLA